MTAAGKSEVNADQRSQTRQVHFTATHWSVVVAAQQADPAAKAVALEQLCQKYWRPVYLFIQHRRGDTHEAEDLTQAFFAYLLERDALKRVDREKGKFRSFLLSSASHFLANDWDKRQTLKRGGRNAVISLDDTGVAESLAGNQNLSTSADKLFDQAWARSVVDQTMRALKDEHAAAGKTALFQVLKPGLTTTVTDEAAARWALKLSISEGAVKVALHRFRRRYGELLRQEIAHTVSTRGEIDEEIRYLFSILS
ncbi:MAG TPA: sigma factor [Verrucomicrobiae bacterium]|jgi:RNA polymerase sigma-70 factor (ECF subfamily)